MKRQEKANAVVKAMMPKDIPILDITPVNISPGSGYTSYKFATPYPWLTTTQVVQPTPAEAYKDAQEWCRHYEQADRLGNMATALGVTEKDDGYVGVVNYYHSNT